MSNITFCYWNELYQDDQDGFDDHMIQYGASVKCDWIYVDTDFIEDGSEVDKLGLGKFWKRQCIDNASDTPQ